MCEGNHVDLKKASGLSGRELYFEAKDPGSNPIVVGASYSSIQGMSHKNRALL